MSYRLDIRAEASAHIAEAFSWYEAQRSGLGEQLLDELDTTFELLKQAPEAGPEVYRKLRRVLVDHFPYAVYYSLSTELVSIRAVIHTSRDPKHWRRFAREP
ncbi:MAG: type II toxin-antitoxin system RelE/ParE family toxin [Gemmatimonadetes bacterium]|nr:type II toxin-antitoxin system RelE/ParE family toxin [Gemmatimonadota bacterium]